MLKRFAKDFTVVELRPITIDYFVLVLKHDGALPPIAAGQFVEVQIPDTAKTFLRRPISIHDVNYQENTISLLVKVVGNGTSILREVNLGTTLNLVFPLGNGFSVDKAGDRPLLIGGGVGVAPLLYLGKVLTEKGCKPEYLFGARDNKGLLRIDEYLKVGDVNIATEDGSEGKQGFVTDHEVISKHAKQYTSFFVCGPTPMMKAVAKIARDNDVLCEVSLENKMACGIGVCLCCVTDTKEGHKCVCSEGPVFNINDLKW